MTVFYPVLTATLDISISLMHSEPLFREATSEKHKKIATYAHFSHKRGPAIPPIISGRRDPRPMNCDP